MCASVHLTTKRKTSPAKKGEDHRGAAPPVDLKDTPACVPQAIDAALRTSCALNSAPAASSTGHTAEIWEPWYIRSKPPSDSETVSIGATQKFRAVEASSVTAALCHPSTTRNSVVGVDADHRRSNRLPSASK